MNKDRILQKLKMAEGYLSGEALSRELGISRAGVWKDIQALRKAGYTIDARPREGYRLLSCPDSLTVQELGQWLPGRDESLLLCFESLDSTNSYLKQHGHSLPEGTVVLVDQQTGGRGRRGRSFQSPAGKGIYLSMLLKPRLPAEKVMSVTALAAVALCNAIEDSCHVRPGIKWTNDLILNGKKICGILTEMTLEGESGEIQYIVLGAGVNVSQGPGDFTPEVAQMASSLSQELGVPLSRAALAGAMIREFDRLRLALAMEQAEYLAAYRRDCITLGKDVQLLWQEDHEQVFALDVDEQFGLVVRHKDGRVETIRTGEVSVRGLYGYLP